jgi:hypothetical protein
MMNGLVSEQTCVFCGKPLHEAALEMTIEGSASPPTS